MNEWQRKEAELLKKENAYYENFNWFEKMIDNHLYFCIFMSLILPVGFDIGFMIGMML